MTANYYYSTGKTFRMPIWEGEVVTYDVKVIGDRIKYFRGYNSDYIAKFVEYFRAIDGCDQYFPHHEKLYREIKHQVSNERRTLRKRSLME